MIADANTFPSKVSFRRLPTPSPRPMFQRRIPRAWRHRGNALARITCLSMMVTLLFLVALYLIPHGGV